MSVSKTPAQPRRGCLTGGLQRFERRERVMNQVGLGGGDGTSALIHCTGDAPYPKNQ